MFDDKIEDLMECLCDCETYFECEWHRRLRGRGLAERKELEREMERERTRRHFFWVHGYEIDGEPHPEMLEDSHWVEGDSR